MVLAFVFTGCTQSMNPTNNGEMAKKEKVAEDFVNETALFDAIRAKDLKLVDELIQKGTDVNTVDKYGYSPLHVATRLNEYGVVEQLIKNGATVNSTDKFGDTPLLDSTRNGTNKLSKLLICNGAKKDVKDKHDMTPLHNASKNNDLFISMLLQSNDMTKMCEKLDITLTSYDENENKICGEIPSGMATKIDVTIANQSSQSEPYGPYNSMIEDNKYCANIDKKISKGNQYIVTAVGDNGVEQDIEIANLDDLRVTAQPVMQEQYIEGLYDALMNEFSADFDKWNAELDKNGLVFRFKDPSVLFKHGSSKLSNNFKTILAEFFPRYLRVLSQYKDQIAEARVEGHTSSVYKSAKTDEERYAKNLKLSTARANNVFDYTISLKDPEIEQNLNWLMDYYKPVGMAYDDLVYDENGNEDQAASRRVEFRINKIMN
jgi:outer membrane protein OmpA-like peptidoglycan-associated protein